MKCLKIDLAKKVVAITQVNAINCKLLTKLSTENVDKRLKLINKKSKKVFRTYSQRIAD